MQFKRTSRQRLEQPVENSGWISVKLEPRISGPLLPTQQNWSPMAMSSMLCCPSGSNAGKMMEQTRAGHTDLTILENMFIDHSKHTHIVKTCVICHCPCALRLLEEHIRRRHLMRCNDPGWHLEYRKQAGDQMLPEVHHHPTTNRGIQQQ